MIVALAENSLDGHRITYLTELALKLKEEGHEVHVYCPNSPELIEKLKNKVCFYEYKKISNKNFPKRFNWSLNILRRWYHLSKLLVKNTPNVDLVFFVSIDYYRFSLGPMIHSRLGFLRKYLDRLIPYILDKCFRFKWAGLSLQPQYRIDHIFLSSNCMSICLLNEYFYFDNKTINDKKIIFPDITDINIRNEKSELAIKILKKANGRKIISVLGALAKRKSILTLLDTAQLMQKKDCFFLFAGEKHFDTFDKFETNRLELVKKIGLDNCYFHFERVADGYEFNELINLSDIIFASYLKFNASSNMLTKISFFKKPIIVSEYGIMGKRVSKYHLGICIKEGEVSEILHAIDKLTGTFDFQNALFHEYFKCHSELVLKNVFKELLERSSIIN